MSGLKIENLRVTYGDVVAVDGVDLQLERGQIAALLGPSGSGKSSLLRAVVGLEPSTGRILWQGEDVSQVPTFRRGFGLMFQDGQLFAHRNVAQNVAYGLKGMSRSRVRSRVARLLEVVGLVGYGSRSVAQLSGGEAQRVALARALAPGPALLGLDEPLSALDRSLRERLSADLREILLSQGTTALYVTHDQDEAFAVADRVGVLIGGRLCAFGSPAQVWSQPPSAQVADFLGYGPILREGAAQEIGLGKSAAMVPSFGGEDAAKQRTPSVVALAPGAVRVVAGISEVAPGLVPVRAPAQVLQVGVRRGHVQVRAQVLARQPFTVLAVAPLCADFAKLEPGSEVCLAVDPRSIAITAE
ncbi:MAG: ABC transporter ATP-binding protein [Actinomycetaceae bacterium]|nr:ABC transporter ATP-binding protein [Actinomycetaceae bacterium]